VLLADGRRVVLEEGAAERDQTVAELTRQVAEGCVVPQAMGENVDAVRLCVQRRRRYLHDQPGGPDALRDVRGSLVLVSLDEHGFVVLALMVVNEHAMVLLVTAEVPLYVPACLVDL
jgi:hypothetical protein